MSRSSTAKSVGRRVRRLKPTPEAGTEPQAVADASAQLLEQIAEGARLCEQVERQLARHPAPGLETLIKLCRAKILKLSVQAQAAPGQFKLVCDLMRPVMEWARLEEKRKERELAEQKYREQKAGSEKTQGGDALRPETLARIERELKLL
jgi:hypothetical protein